MHVKFFVIDEIGSLKRFEYDDFIPYLGIFFFMGIWLKLISVSGENNSYVFDEQKLCFHECSFETLRING